MTDLEVLQNYRAMMVEWQLVQEKLTNGRAGGTAEEQLLRQEWERLNGEKEAFDRVLGSLKQPQLRMTALLWFAYGLSIQSMARRMNISERQVSRLRRTLQETLRRREAGA